MRHSYLKNIGLVLLALSLSSCGFGGGGGGGGEEEQSLRAATVSLELDPGKIRVGNRTQARVTIQDVDKEGVLLILRYPEFIELVPSSAVFEVRSEEIPLAPSLGPQTKDNLIYVVYYLPREVFGKGNFAEVRIQFRGLDPDMRGKVEVDVDLHDPDKRPSQEFDFSDPLFSAEDEVDISVTE